MHPNRQSESITHVSSQRIIASLKTHTQKKEEEEALVCRSRTFSVFVIVLEEGAPAGGRRPGRDSPLFLEKAHGSSLADSSTFRDLPHALGPRSKRPH